MAEPTIVREPPRAAGRAVELLRLDARGATPARDAVAVEEPLEIRLNGWRWLVTMRTPGDDADLIVGLLAAEGVIAAAAEVAQVVFTRHPDDPELANVADVRLARPLGDLQKRLVRNQVLASSSCGLCGASAVEAVRARGAPVDPGPEVDAATLAGLAARLAEAQPVFRATGGLHAAALFDAGGRLLAAREDVGRHNATDKVLGWRLRAGAAGRDAAILMVSGRASFEIVQKALAARVPIVAAVSAPSSLAADLAEAAGITLAGFVRGAGLNVYAGRARVRARAGALADAGAAASDDALAAAAVETIPRAMRALLDAAGLKISLADWQALTVGERTRLLALVAEGDAAAFAGYLRARVEARTGRAPRPLAPRHP